MLKWSLIEDEAGFIGIYPYGEKAFRRHREEVSPKKYPCFCRVVERDGGLGGSERSVQKVYPPEGVDLDSFRLGLDQGAWIEAYGRIV